MEEFALRCLEVEMKEVGYETGAMCICCRAMRMVPRWMGGLDTFR